MNIDEILSGFEPVFRSRLERKVFETTVEGYTFLWPGVLFVTPMYVHWAYVAFRFASHSGSRLAWVLAGIFALGAVCCLICAPFVDRIYRIWRKLAEESGWSIAQFQRLAAQFPDRKKKKLLKELERNLRNAAVAME